MKTIVQSLTFAVVMIIASTQAWANSAPVVSSVTASQRGDDSKLVDITYDLADADGDPATVWVAVSDDNGATWQVPARTFTGDIGQGVTPDIGKSIVWDAGADMAGKVGNFKVRILAEDGNGPEEMLPVLAGSFPYQTQTTPDPNDWVWVPVDTFLIDKYEITNQRYLEFLNNDDPCGIHYYGLMEINWQGDPDDRYYTIVPNKEKFPIRYVSYYDAEAFATWWSGQKGATYRLPNEYEWEKAAAWGGGTPYKYGCSRNDIDCTWCNHPYCIGGPTEVGHYDGSGSTNDADSPYGCYDMTGNVWEWTSNIFYSGHAVRGGHWESDATQSLATSRSWGELSSRNSNIGFRLVQDLD